MRLAGQFNRWTLVSLRHKRADVTAAAKRRIFSHALTAPKIGNLTYGPLTNDDFVNLTFDARNRLLNAGGVTNLYDAMNNRIGQFHGTNAVQYVVDPNWGLPQTLMSIKNGVTNCYVYGAGLLYQVTETANGETTLTYHYDYRGSTVALTDDSGDAQTTIPNAFTNPLTKLIAAGGNHTVAALFSPLVQYPVDVTKDVLLIYNSNSTNSIAVKDYYVAHRPMIAVANILAIACDVGEITTSNDCDSQIMSPVLNWLTNNPTKRPQYVILSFETPARLSSYPPGYGSVSYHLHNILRGWQPFVNHLNANTLADYEAYVNRLAYIWTNYSPGKLIISAGSGGHGDTNYSSMLSWIPILQKHPTTLLLQGLCLIR